MDDMFHVGEAVYRLTFWTGTKWHTTYVKSIALAPKKVSRFETEDSWIKLTDNAKLEAGIFSED